MSESRVVESRRLPIVSVIVATWFALASCGGSARSGRPPADYPPPPPEHSQGEVLGADRQTPGDKLMTGPRVGTTGVKPAGSAEKTEPKK